MTGHLLTCVGMRATGLGCVRLSGHAARGLHLKLLAKASGDLKKMADGFSEICISYSHHTDYYTPNWRIFWDGLNPQTETCFQVVFLEIQGRQ